MTTTLNKKNTKRRTNTQRKHKNKKSHGGRNEFGPGKVYYFGEGNTDELDRLMQKSTVPTLFRHSDNECPHCNNFEEPWSEIEEITQYPPQSHSVASLDPSATEHVLNNYPDYPRVNGVPAVILVNKDGVPIEHTGPNTLEAIQNFLDRNGLKIVMKDQAHDQLQDADLGAGLGAGLGAPSAPESDLGAPSAPESKTILTGVTETVSNIDDKIKNSLTALTEPINFNNLFGTATEQAANAVPPAQTQTQDQTQTVNAKVPQLPSIGGRSKKGKHSRRRKDKRSSRSRSRSRRTRYH